MIADRPTFLYAIRSEDSKFVSDCLARSDISTIQTKNYGYIVYYSPSPEELHEGIPFQVEVHKIDTNPYSASALGLFKAAKVCIDGEIPHCSNVCEYCRWKENSGRY